MRSPSPVPTKKTRSRSLLILVSCGLWLLYFDLVVATPGCSDSSNAASGTDAAVVDAPFIPAVDAAVDAPVDAPGQEPDATLTDASSDSGADSGNDGPSTYDAESGTPAPDPCNPEVTISQVYAGGGEAAAAYANDYVDIINRTLHDVDLTGYSLQVNDGTSTGAWTVIPLSGTMLQSTYATIVLGGGGQGGQAVTSPIATGTFNLPLAGGRVSIVASTTPLTGASVGLDSLAYGTATAVEGTPATLGQGALQRKINGCQDTNVNGTDFATIPPLPRNGVSAAGCFCPN